MKKFRRKPHSGRRKRSSEPAHWLNEGVSGQESLLSELHPHLFACDPIISSLALSQAFKLDGERPFALLVPPEESIGWQICYLSKHFNVYLWAEQVDDLLKEAADRFQTKVIEGELEQALEQAVDLIVFTCLDWESADAFLFSLTQARGMLREEGVLVVVVRGKEVNGELRVCLSDSEEIPVATLDSREWFPLGMPHRIERVKLADPEVFTGESLNLFLKRNRDFFGRNIREALTARLLEPEFHYYMQNSTDTFEGVVLVWQSDLLNEKML